MKRNSPAWDVVFFLDLLSGAGRYTVKYDELAEDYRRNGKRLAYWFKVAERAGYVAWGGNGSIYVTSEGAAALRAWLELGAQDAARDAGDIGGAL
jgi:hypothetical protein